MIKLPAITSIFTTLLLALWAAAPVSASYFSDVMAQPSLLDYWRLGESQTSSPAADAKGSLPGTYTVATTGAVTLGQPGAIAGDPNTAAHFSGTGYVSIPDSAALDATYSSSGAGLTALTMAAWINPDSLSGLQVIMGRWGGGPGPSQNGGDQFLFYTNGTQLGITVSNTSAEQGISGGTLTAGQYAFVVSTWNSTGAYQLFINGVSVGTGTESNPGMEPSFRPFEVGAQDNNSGRFFQGTIDEAATFSSVLTLAEIQTLYNDGLTASLTVPAPEPSTFVLSALGAGCMVLAARRRRARAAQHLRYKANW